MEINDGGLYFKASLNNDELNRAVDEVHRRIQGLSDGTVAGGKAMEDAMKATFESIDRAFQKLDAAGDEHIETIKRLEREYRELGVAAGGAYSKEVGSGGQLTERQAAIVGEIKARKELLKEVQETSAALMNEQKQLSENAKVKSQFRTQILNVKQAMMEMVDAGKQATPEYAALEQELKRLQGAMHSVNQQTKLIVGLKDANLQGIISGLSGVAGGFSVATGAISLFAGENDNLQRVMARVQSVMALTIGMQQVSQTLNKDSAFQLVTMNKLRTWWAGIVAKGTKAEVANTAATQANVVSKRQQAGATAQAAKSTVIDTATKGVNTAATKGATIANIGLAGALRMVGAAIKSIPVIGWIIAGISALVAVIGRFIRKSKEAKKAQEEFNASVVEESYKSIGAIESLAFAWNKLGDDLDAKKKFIDENKKAFDELGVAIQDVADAENLLNKNKDAFIDAQIAKAKAAIFAQQAMDKIKEIAEAELKADAMADTQLKQTWFSRFTGVTQVKVVDNKDKAKLEKEIKEWRKELDVIYTNEAKEIEKEREKLKDAEIKSIEQYSDGTVGALEQAIERERNELDKLKGDNEAYKAKLKEIRELEEELSKLIDISEKDSGKKEDPIITRIEERKKAYQDYFRWVSAGLGDEAKIEFADALADGDDYLSYLNRLREDTTLTAEQIKHVLNEISSETKDAVIAEFNKTLNEQIADADSVLGKLEEIRKSRADLSDEDPLKEQKEESLQKAESEIIKQVEEEHRIAQEEYKKYLDEKIDADVQYFEKRKKLEEQLSKEDDSTKRRVIEMQLEALDFQQDLSDQQQYDNMLQEYQSYQEEREKLSAEFDKKIAIATEKGNAELVKRLEEAKAKAMAEIDIEEFTSSDTWTQLFGNLDNLTVAQMIQLRDNIEAEWAQLDLPPDQLDAIRAKIDEVNDQIQQRNPFLALIDGIRRYKKEEGDVNFKDLAKSLSGSFDMIKGTFDEVVGAFDKLGIETDEGTQEVIQSISGMLGGASDLAMGIASGNPLQIIQGSIDLITNGITLIAGAKSRQLDKTIREHEENVRKLEKAYQDLERAVDKALGSARYDSQKKLIDNLKQQQKDYQAMAKAEAEKKKADQDKIDEYTDAAEENRRRIEDLVDSMREDILGMSIESAANELGNALLDAFAAGEDAAEAWGKKVDDIVANIMRKMIIQKMVEEPLAKILNKYTGQWVDDEGNFLGFDAVMATLTGMGDELKGFGEGLADALENLPDDIKKYFTGGDDASALTGAVKGMSEETASLMSGYINAVRINQIESIGVMRNQLLALHQIASNTSHNAKLPEILGILQTMANSDTLRPTGTWSANR